MSHPDPSTVLDGNLLHLWQQTAFDAGMRGVDPPAGYGWQEGLAPALPDGSYVVAPQYFFSPAGGDDAVWINNALTSASAANTGFSNGGVVRLMPVVYKQQTPVVIPASNQSLLGPGGSQSATLTCTASSSIAAQIIVGQSAVLQRVTVSGIQTFGNANSGHSVQWRASNSKLADMILQNPSGDCLHIDPNTIGGAAEQDVFSNILGITPAGYGWWSDKITDSDAYSITMDGGPANTLGGNIGFNITAGANIRFHGCHAYLFTNGGMQMAGSQHSMIGGELESNGTADLIVNGAIFCTFSQVVFYDQANSSPPSQHIHVTGSAAHIDIADCPWYPALYTVPSFITVDAGSTAYAHDCLRYNPTGLQTPPTYTSGTATTNPFPFRVRVVAGSSATLTALNGTTLGTALTEVELGPGESVTPTGAGGSWQWFGL